MYRERWRLGIYGESGCGTKRYRNVSYQAHLSHKHINDILRYIAKLSVFGLL